MTDSVESILLEAKKQFQKGDFEGSIGLLSKIPLDKKNPQVLELLAYSYGNLGNLPKTMEILDELSKDPKCPVGALYEYGSLMLQRGGRNSEVIQILEKALYKAPHSFEILHDLAAAYGLEGRKEDALAKFLMAYRINPNSSELLYNIGRIYDDFFQEQKAIEFYQKSLNLDSKAANTWANLGLDLNYLGKYKEGVECLSRALEIEPKLDFILGDLIHGQMQMGSWSAHSKNLETLKKRVEASEKVIHPFHFLSLVDDPRLQMQASKIYAKSKFGQYGVTQLGIKKANQKIKIAYFSADFRNHAITNMTAEVFELHDKERFEVYAFSIGPKVLDEQRARLEKSFHEFIDVSSLVDDEVLNLVIKKEIDIAIDLGGHTEKARTALFARRLAPIQVSWLGYIGSSQLPNMDYIIADKTVIPDQNIGFFSEKIIFMPNSFQVNDRKRSISNRKFTRNELGLPENQFIYCCFNNGYKITPELFDSWCRILQAVENGVLWLYAANNNVVNNLRAEASTRGVNPERLIFGEQLPGPEYLARYRMANLFLDTFIYNAGTTAIDALWMGLPVLTRQGQSMPSRMASSILKSIDLPELITQTSLEYEQLAIELGHNQNKLDEIAEKLKANKFTTTLFDTTLFTKDLEKAYRSIYDLHTTGESPKNIVIH